MRRVCAHVMLLFAVLGCTRQDDAENVAERLAALKNQIKSLTNVTGRAVVASSVEIANQMTTITNRVIRFEMAREWEFALYARPENGVDMWSRGAEMRFVREAMGIGVLNVLRESKCTDMDVWGVKFRLLKWMQEQVARCHPVTYDPMSRQNRESWSGYESAVLIYENTVEQFEFDFGDVGGWYDASLKEIVREDFSKIIGRRVRSKEEMSRLGFYSKLARERIAAEKRGSASQSKVEWGQTPFDNTLNSLGESGVSKHGHNIVRTTNDVIRLDGVVVHEGCNK